MKKWLKKKLGFDCPVDLIPLVGKTKEWCMAATKVLIQYDMRLKRLELMVAATIGLSAMVLTVIVKMSIGG